MRDGQTSWRRRLDKKLLAHRTASERAREETTALEALDERIEALTEAQALAQQVAQQVQTRAHAKIAELVTKALSLFEEPYTFRIEIDRKRGKTEARLLFERDGETVDPLSAAGGGVVDVAAFALRIACLLLHRPPLRKLLIMDEPLRHLSREYRSRARTFLEQISADLGVQFILVTHDPGLAAGTVVRLA